MSGQTGAGSALHDMDDTSAATPVTRTPGVPSGDDPPARDDRPNRDAIDQAGPASPADADTTPRRPEATAEPDDGEGSCPAWCRLPSGHRKGNDVDPHYAVTELMDLPAVRDTAGRRVQIEIWQYPSEPPVICLVDDDGGDDLLPPMLAADALALSLTVAKAAACALTDAVPAWTGRDSPMAAAPVDVADADADGAADDDAGHA